MQRPQRLQPLIDGDILTYQAAFGGQDRESGEVHSFEYVAELVNKSIADICLAVESTEPPIIFLSGTRNFRNDIARAKPYKGNRKQEKPFHYYNVRAYLCSLPNTVLTDGIEADDAMAIAQTDNLNGRFFYNDDPATYPFTVICTRDKDLRMVPGWHYGWEHHLQPEFHLQYVDDMGWLEFNEAKTKITGTGYLFFCSQLITGDTTDNVPGLPKKGDKAAWDLLKEVVTKEEADDVVKKAYQETIGDDWRDYLLEQGRLLWMVRKVDHKGLPELWEIPK